MEIFRGSRRNKTILQLCKSLTFLIFDPYFVFYWLCWILIKLTRHIHQPIPFLNNWLTDFVYVPIVIHLSLIFGHIFIFPAKAKGYSLNCILILCGFAALVFEGILPQLTDYYIFDIWDIVTYFAGGLFYFIFHQGLLLDRLQEYIRE